MEDQIDILNVDGTFTGRSGPRSEIHKHGFWHRTVYVWIVNSKREALIQLRSPLKSNDPNLWDISSAGHISAGEDSKTAAIREVKEELGMDILADELKYIGETKSPKGLSDPNFTDREIHDVFVVLKDVDINDLVLQPEEVADAKWINHLDLKKDLTANPSAYVEHSEAYEILSKYIETNFEK